MPRSSLATKANHLTASQLTRHISAKSIAGKENPEQFESSQVLGQSRAFNDF